jgi:sugar-specific transcriptional regulator TrmB/putative sterol carrier protein
MQLQAALQQIGFTEYEAKVYLALLANPGTTGYEVSRHSGVPRAKVYEVLEALARRGIVLVEQADGKQLYQPVEHESLLAAYSRDLTSLLTKLGSELGRVSVLGREPRFLTLRDRRSVMERCRQICETAQAQVLLSGWPEELRELRPALLAAERRGVACYVLSYGPLDAALPRLVEHSVTPLQHLQVAAQGRWLTAAADMERCLMVQVTGPERAMGLWTDFAGLATLIGGAIQHDIYLMVVARHLGEETLLRLPENVRGMLAGLWGWSPKHSPQVDLPHGTPSAAQILAAIRRRLEATPAAAEQMAGRYEFRLSGDDDGAGVHHLIAGGGAVAAGAGAVESPDLVVDMSTIDFRALAVGRLPAGAVYVPGRIRVTGDVRLAAGLRHLLGA